MLVIPWCNGLCAQLISSSYNNDSELINNTTQCYCRTGQYTSTKPKGRYFCHSSTDIEQKNYTDKLTYRKNTGVYKLRHIYTKSLLLTQSTLYAGYCVSEIFYLYLILGTAFIYLSLDQFTTGLLGVYNQCYKISCYNSNKPITP